MKPEGAAAGRAERRVILPRRLEQGEGAHDIGGDERRRSVDRAIDMAFGREVHHSVGLLRREDLAHRGGVGDVGTDQHVAVVGPRLLQRLLRGRIGQLVDVDHDVVAVPHQVAHHRGTDEAAAAGQQEFHLAGYADFTSEWEVRSHPAIG